jgi:dihydrofolate reductase
MSSPAPWSVSPGGKPVAHDIVVTGSASILRALMANDLVDEYRLLVFPLVLGEGERLFADGTPPIGLTLTSAETVDAAVRLIYARPASELR